MKTLALLAFLVTLVACTPAPAPIADTREADAAAIRATEEAWKAAWSTKVADDITTYWAENATLMAPGVPTVKGAAAIKPVIAELVADSNFSLSLQTVTVEASRGGDFGYTQGTYTVTATDPATKKAVTEKGKYLTLFEKQADGSWKCVQDIWNADGPATPVEAAGKIDRLPT
jgi:ketosteroid isomerase-like protein